MHVSGLMMCSLNSVDPSPNWQEAQGKALASIRDSGPAILEKSLAPLWLNFFIHKMGKRCLSNPPQAPINSDNWGRYEWKYLVPRLQPKCLSLIASFLSTSVILKLCDLPPALLTDMSMSAAYAFDTLLHISLTGTDTDLSGPVW